MDLAATISRNAFVHLALSSKDDSSWDDRLARENSDHPKEQHCSSITQSPGPSNAPKLLMRFHWPSHDLSLAIVIAVSSAYFGIRYLVVLLLLFIIIYSVRRYCSKKNHLPMLFVKYCCLAESS